MTKNNQLEVFLEQFWFAPQDAFLRAFEARIWATQKFKPPVLDIGCGDGQMGTFLYATQGKIDIGIDIDEQAVALARNLRKYKKVFLAAAEKMPFENESFETVASNSTFEHIKDDLQAVGETARVLKPNGYFFLTVPSERLPRILKELGVKGETLEKFNHRVSHFRYRCLEEWKEILDHYGLKIIHSRYYFPKRALKVWYWLFKIATFKPYHRELWSYLRDSSYGRLVPAFFLKYVFKSFLRPYMSEIFSDKGTWIFIIAQKVK